MLESEWNSVVLEQLVELGLLQRIVTQWIGWNTKINWVRYAALSCEAWHDG